MTAQGVSLQETSKSSLLERSNAVKAEKRSISASQLSRPNNSCTKTSSEISQEALLQCTEVKDIHRPQLPVDTPRLDPASEVLNLDPNTAIANRQSLLPWAHPQQKTIAQHHHQPTCSDRICDSPPDSWSFVCPAALPGTPPGVCTGQGWLRGSHGRSNR